MKELGHVGKLTDEFFTSLIYLSNDHILWTKLRNQEYRSQFICTVIEFIYVNHFIENRGFIPVNKDSFINTLTSALLPLIRRTLTSPNEDTKCATWKSLRTHAIWYYMRADKGNDKRKEILYSYARKSQKEAITRRFNIIL